MQEGARSRLAQAMEGVDVEVRSEECSGNADLTLTRLPC